MSKNEWKSSADIFSTGKGQGQICLSTRQELPVSQMMWTSKQKHYLKNSAKSL